MSKLKVFTKALLPIGIGSYILYQYAWPDLKANIEYKNLNDQYVTEANIDENIETEEMETIEETTETKVETETVEVEVISPEEQDTYLLDNGYDFKNIDFDSLNEINEDTVGYIELPGTNIEYPVVQGDDNEYYLHHSIEKEDSTSGTIFVDNRVDLSLGDDSSTTQTSTISFFGHHMKNKSMFHDLMSYKEQSFVDENPYGVYYSEDGSIYALEVVACYLTSGDTDENIYIKNIDDEETLNDYMNYVSENALTKTDVEVKAGDKLVTLVTCSYEHDNYRCVVLCKAVKQYENENEVTLMR